MRRHGDQVNYDVSEMLLLLIQRLLAFCISVATRSAVASSTTNPRCRLLVLSSHARGMHTQVQLRQKDSGQSHGDGFLVKKL